MFLQQTLKNMKSCLLHSVNHW